MKKILNILMVFMLVLFSCSRNSNSVQILYYGHSCFEFNYADQRILIDPFIPEWFDYILPRGKFNLGFSTHDAKDHSYFEGLNIDKIYFAKGETDEFRLQQGNNISVQRGKISEFFMGRKVSFWTVPSFHDEVQGRRDGVNGILCFDFNGIRITHLGDIGHVLEEKQLSGIGEVDILMVPVDSYYIIELEKARAIVDQLSPAIVIPMHYKTDKSHNKAYGDDLDKFVKMFENVKKCGTQPITITEKECDVDPYLLLLEYLKDDSHL